MPRKLSKSEREQLIRERMHGAPTHKTPGGVASLEGHAKAERRCGRCGHASMALVGRRRAPGGMRLVFGCAACGAVIELSGDRNSTVLITAAGLVAILATIAAASLWFAVDRFTSPLLDTAEREILPALLALVTAVCVAVIALVLLRTRREIAVRRTNPLLREG